MKHAVWIGPALLPIAWAFDIFAAVQGETFALIAPAVATVIVTITTAASLRIRRNW